MKLKKHYQKILVLTVLSIAAVFSAITYSPLTFFGTLVLVIFISLVVAIGRTIPPK